MKIDRLKLVNFMGIKGSFEFELPKIAALVGPNGMGKTTVMNAIRFALTGEEPAGDIINKDATQARTEITLTDPADGVQYTFMRLKDREKPSKCMIDGKNTTKKTMDQKIEDILRIPLDKVKVLSSSEVVASMKPQEFSSFILDYIPEKLKLEKIISLIPASTLGMVEILEANLPSEEIDLTMLGECEGICRQNRKELKDVIARKKALYDSCPKENPGETKEEVEKKLNALLEIESVRKVYLAKKEAYDKAVESAKKHEALLSSTRAEVSAIAADRPDPGVLDALRKEEASARESIQNQKVAISSATGAVTQLETALSNLENPVCPLSEKIICHQDKSAAKEDLVESIASTKEGIGAMQAELKKAEEKLAKVEADIRAYQEGAALYDKKIALMKQLKTLEDNKPEIPEKPEEVEVVDVAEEDERLRGLLKTIDAYEEGVKLAEQLAKLETNLSDYEALVKALAEKGPVRTGVISEYLKVFEDLCNERSMKVRPEITFEFVSDDGVVVLMDNGKGSKLPYESLSGGEKAYMIFIIMDMLSSLCGTNLLLLDELSVIDEKCFDALLDIVLAYAGDYDHVLLAAVDHKDTVESIDHHGIPTLSLSVHEKEAECGIPFVEAPDAPTPETAA